MFNETEEKHPSYGQLAFTRIQCHGQTLYGSNLKHNTIIRMDLKHSTRRRGINHDWYYGDEMITSVVMSQNQFSELITSLNMGDGIPVTLDFTERDGKIEPPEFESKIEQHENEFKDITRKFGEELVQLQKTMKELLAGSGTVKKSEREDMLAQVDRVTQDLISNMPYVDNCFKETMDKTVADAKGTIEAFYQERVVSAGIDALSADAPRPPELIENDKD